MEGVTKHPGLGPYELSEEFYYLTPPPFGRVGPAGLVPHGQPEPVTLAAVLVPAAAGGNEKSPGISINVAGARDAAASR